MNRRPKIIVSVTGIFIVLLALVGITFAYFLTRIQGNTNPTSISVTTADLKLVYGDGNNEIVRNNIEPGTPIPAKTFTVTNEGNETVENFNIYMEDVINSLSRKEDLVYAITCENTTPDAESTDCTEFNVIENEVTSDDELIFPSVMSVIATDTLDEDETHTYTIEVEYKYLDNVDQSEDMDKRFSAKVNIYDEKIKFLATEIIKNAKSNDSVEYNKSKYILPSSLGTNNASIPAKDLSLENERILSYTFDNFEMLNENNNPIRVEGTSFYFRGNVEDNYVTFANMCWRVVRINGDGSIKVILEDQDEPCSETMNGNWDIGSGNPGYSVYEPGTFYASDGVTANDAKVWLYDYLNGNTDYENSMAVAFQDFQNDLSATISEMYNKNINQTLKSGDWCLGDAGYDEETGKLLSESEIRDYIINADDIHYGDVYHAWYLEDTPITLKCNGTILSEFSDDSPMYVSALTINELQFSGFVFENFNFEGIKNIYLYNKYQKNNNLYFLSLSHSAFWVFNDNFAFIGGAGLQLSEMVSVENSSSFRPSIILSNDTKILSGNGTSKQAYLVG